MAEITKEFLSASGSGRAVKVAATVSPGTVLHAAHATLIDEVWLWAYNSDTVPREVTIQFGGTVSPDQDIKQTIPAKSGLVWVVQGQPLSASLEVRAYAEAANVVTVGGFVNRVAN